MFPIDEPVTCMLACFTLWLLGRLQTVYMSLQASIIACGSVSYEMSMVLLAVRRQASPLLSEFYVLEVVLGLENPTTL